MTDTSQQPDTSHQPGTSQQPGTSPQQGTTDGRTIWLTGLPSAGKSTLAASAAALLRADGRRVQVLDGDEVRPYLSAGLGFSRADRDMNVTRIGFVARLLASHGVVVLVPVIAPYASARAAVRADHDAHGVAFAEVFVATPLTVASERDVKGLYARQSRGEISGLTGVDDPYEEPTDAELVVDTSATPLAAGARMVADLARPSDASTATASLAGTR